MNALGVDKICVFTFDDLWQSQIDFCLPRMLEHGFRGTFFVSNEAFGRCAWHDAPDPIAKPENVIPLLHDAGMEIGNHQYHFEAFACTLPELDEKIMRLGAPRPVTFCYPAFYDKFNATGVNEAYLATRLGLPAGRRESFYGGSGPAHNLSLGLHPTHCTGVFGCRYGPNNFEKDLFEKVGGNNVGVFAFHQITNDGESSVRLSEKDFIRVLDIANNAGAAVISLRELVAMQQHPMLTAPRCTPRAAIQAARPWIKGTRVFEIGTALGDNLLHLLWDGGARSIAGMEVDKEKARKCRRRGLDVMCGDVFKSHLPEADLYYFWIGAKVDARVFDHLISLRRKMRILRGADYKAKGDVRISTRYEGMYGGSGIDVDYNEGDVFRQNGKFRISCIDLKGE
jgi:hypothetical protein